MNDRDESRRRLNYYSRSSPKKRRLPLQHTLHSPLLPPISIHRTVRPHSRSRRSTASPQTSFKIEILEVSHSSAHNEILIEDALQQEILIRDEETDDLIESQRKVSAFEVEKGSSIEGEIEDAERMERMRGTDILIEDDQNLQPQQIHPPQQDFIKIQNQQQQTMNRQFTFGQELAQAQKAEIEVLPLTVPEQEEQEDTSYPQSPSQEQETQLSVSNLEYGESRPHPKLDLALVEQYQQGHDYQSPKFNVVPHRRYSDKWITVEDYHLLTSPDKREKILIEEETKNVPSHKSSARTSLSLRPYGRSIALLSEVVGLVPANLAQVYEKMHIKLVGDQIQAQERQERQEMKMKTLRMLLQVQRQRIPCQSFLLAAKGSVLQERIEINKLIIQSLLRVISQKD